jgi:hypothetical protein
MTRTLSIVIVQFIVPLGVLAQDGSGELAIQPESEAPDPLDRWDVAAWDHFEVSMGFIAGQRAYGASSFELTEGNTPGAVDLVRPFEEGPFERHTSLGLRYDVRLVAAYTRMTVGVDIPFAQFTPSEAQGIYSVGGVDRMVSIKSISPFLLHFGIGAEIPIGPIAPFVDVLGHLRWTDAVLTIDGAEHTYSETGFGFSARAGMRIHVRRWFYASLAGELGMAPEISWLGELSVGFAIM